MEIQDSIKEFELQHAEQNVGELYMNVSDTNTKTNPSKIVESIVLPVKTRELIPRACNLRHKTQYLITKANKTYKARKYNQNTQENTFEPETNNMHFIFTNFNGKTHGEYSKPSFDQDYRQKLLRSYKNVRTHVGFCITTTRSYGSLFHSKQNENGGMKSTE